ncbi:MAG: flagellar basal body rod protein FlgB [Desulfosalsimonas sp.]
MSSSGFFDTTMQVLDKTLSLRSQKQRVISSNIANSETPGYEKLEMDFEKDLARASDKSGTGMVATHPRHIGASGDEAIAGLQADISRQPAQNAIGDGNNVSLDREMKDLSENQIRYEAAVKMLTKKFNMLKSVIRERA